MHIDKLTKPLDEAVMSLSAYSTQGKRNHMEDFYDVGYQMKPCDQRCPNEWPYEYFYFGVFDGHGGSEAASFAKKHLLKHITKQSDFWSSDDQDVMRAIRQGFADCHTDMRKSMPKWARTSKVLPSTAGTTASILLIRNGKFYTGHVGDSRIVIGTENVETKHWISSQVTEDHKPESPQETQRIQRAGGEVKNKIGVHRVVWKRPVLNQNMEDKLNCGPDSEEYDNFMQLVPTYPVSEKLVDSYQTIPFLAIARSLGDFWSLNPHSGLYVVSPEPDVTCRSIQANDKCILLATDGLWNVMNCTQVVRVMQELDCLKSGKRDSYRNEYFSVDNFYDVAGADSENHAQSLVYIAYQIWERKRLRSDNITVVAAMLHDIMAYLPKVAKPYATRANIHSEKRVSVDLGLQSEAIQLGMTHEFAEKIMLNREPELCRNMTEIYYKRPKIESFLVLPPTLLEQELDMKKSNLVYPQNYIRLSAAECRKIRPYAWSDSYIFIKNVSDDPADESLRPTRIGKSGKKVRDASCQATQSIHDFGQPWNQLTDMKTVDEIEFDQMMYDDYNDLEWDGDRRYDELHHHETDAETDRRDKPAENEERNDMDDHDEDDNPDEDDYIEFTDDNCIVGDEETDDDHIDRASPESAKNYLLKTRDIEDIPQLRCLLNYTPPRRSTRNGGNHVSVSENSKRKQQSSVNDQKTKRRKSQPVRADLTQV